MILKRLLGSPRATTNGSQSGWWQPFVDAGLVRLDQGDGVPASAEGALAYHAWYRAISLIAQKCAAVPKHLLRRTQAAGGSAGEGKERAREHPAYRLVHERANAEQTAFQFWLQMAGHVPSRGNAYAAIYRVGGVAVELIPMDPDRTHPVRRNGELWYATFPFGYEGHEGIRLRASEVLHFRGFGFDGLVGYPVWAKAAEEIGLARGSAKLQGARYRNSGRPAMLLETEQKLSDAAKTRLREDWERMHQGLDNAGRTAILDSGLKAKTVSMTAEDLEQSGAAQMSIVAISNFTGVPPSKLGASGRNYASQEQEDQAFVQDGLDFYLNIFEDEAGAKLLTDAERSAGYEVKANREALLRASMRDKHEAARIAGGGRPWKSPNEIRKDFDMPPSAEPDADQLLTPLNMGQGGPQNDPADPADSGPGRPSQTQASLSGSGQSEGSVRMSSVRAAAALAMTDASRRMVRRVALHATRATATPAKYMEWVGAFQADHKDVVTEAFAPARLIVASLKGEVGDTAGVFLSELRAEYTRVADSVGPAKLAAAVEKLNAELETRMPRRMCELFLGAE